MSIVKTDISTASRNILIGRGLGTNKQCATSNKPKDYRATRRGKAAQPNDRLFDSAPALPVKTLIGHA